MRRLQFHFYSCRLTLAPPYLIVTDLVRPSVCKIALGLRSLPPPSQPSWSFGGVGGGFVNKSEWVLFTRLTSFLNIPKIPCIMSLVTFASVGLSMRPQRRASAGHGPTFF